MPKTTESGKILSGTNQRDIATEVFENSNAFDIDKNNISKLPGNTKETIKPIGINKTAKNGKNDQESSFESFLEQYIPNKSKSYFIQPNKDIKLPDSPPAPSPVNINNDLGGKISQNLRNLFGMNIGQDYTQMVQWQSHYYNRFKVPVIDDALQRGFAHVFFVRPDCNFLTDDGKDISSTVKNKTSLYYALKRNPSLIYELVADNSKVSNNSHDFMLFLSNKVSSFSLSDEYIKSDTYGQTYSGHKISYGKHNVESKSAGNFSISFIDDRNFSVYHLHKIWMDYISDVYRGNMAPKTKYIDNRILDYATCCYYIVTAEDGETIIFWSKYYGVFPTTAPSTNYAWAKGNIISVPEIEISYNYSFKEDYNPMSLVDLNTNSHVAGYSQWYQPIYDKKLGHSGMIWVGAPFIMYSSTDNNFKLKFKPGLRLN